METSSFPKKNYFPRDNLVELPSVNGFHLWVNRFFGIVNSLFYLRIFIGLPLGLLGLHRSPSFQSVRLLSSSPWRSIVFPFYQLPMNLFPRTSTALWKPVGWVSNRNGCVCKSILWCHNDLSLSLSHSAEAADRCGYISIRCYDNALSPSTLRLPYFRSSVTYRTKFPRYRFIASLLVAASDRAWPTTERLSKGIIVCFLNRPATEKGKYRVPHIDKPAHTLSRRYYGTSERKVIHCYLQCLQITGCMLLKLAR